MLKFTGIIFLLSALLAGCSSVGPKTVPRDQFNYNNAISESTQEQLLVNLIRLRYNETPVFLKVGSVISQYTRIATANIGVAANSSVTGDNTANASGRMSWADRPTITYIPINGQEFSRNLLTPVPPGAIFSLIQSGWPSAMVLPLTVWSINNINNEVARPNNRRQADHELIEFLNIWRRLRDAGVLGVRRAKTEDNTRQTLLIFREGALPKELKKDFERFTSLLNIDPHSREFPMVYGRVQEKPNSIAVLSGSVWEIMLNMAWQIEVPPEHIQSGRTGQTFQSTREHGVAPIEILYSAHKPADAYVAVFIQNYWFYIDQRDGKSKGAFSFLQLLLNLAETSTPDYAPVFTISN